MTRVQSKAPPADDCTQHRVVGRVVVVVEAIVVVVGPTVVVVGTITVVVVVPGAVVEVVPWLVVVVVDPGQPPGPHASQQLGTCPTHALPPSGARQERELLRMLQ